jgi:hypothetical protein
MTTPVENDDEQPYERDREVWVGRHPSVRHFEPLFDFEHLRPGMLREVSSLCCAMAETLLGVLPDSPELLAGLRKLLEGKDCFVRAAL